MLPKFARRLALAAAFLSLFALPLRAAPAPLETDADMAAFAKRVQAYAAASLVRWTVVAPTRAEAEARIAAIVAMLPPFDRGLAGKLIAQVDAKAPGPRGYLSAQLGSSASNGACAWQVWVSDPDLPAPEGQTALLPLLPRDRAPVGPKATFRVGHFGFVQSKLYAFDETAPGAIRDLASVQDADIGVPQDAATDYIFLAAARKAAPFLDRVKAALAGSPGERRNLGPDYALRERLLVAGRGIGANIESVPSSMIARRAPVVAAGPTPVGEAEEPMMETCLYELTRAK